MSQKTKQLFFKQTPLSEPRAMFMSKNIMLLLKQIRWLLAIYARNCITIIT